MNPFTWLADFVLAPVFTALGASGQWLFDVPATGRPLVAVAELAVVAGLAALAVVVSRVRAKRSTR